MDYRRNSCSEKLVVFFIFSSKGTPLNLELGLLNMPDAKEPEVVVRMGFGCRDADTVKRRPLK